MYKAVPADADDARRRCVEWGRLRRPMLIMLVPCVERGYLGPLYRFTCVIRLVPTILTVATADADDARMLLTEYERRGCLMLMKFACIG